ncbi:MAG TPA: hypothetical protein VI756_29220 [Blastocatellia bacterium]
MKRIFTNEGDAEQAKGRAAQDWMEWREDGQGEFLIPGCWKP